MRHLYSVVGIAVFLGVSHGLSARSIMTIFVHGTVDVASRRAELLHASELLLAEGLVAVPREQLELLQYERYRGRPIAAYHMLGAFDRCDQVRLQSDDSTSQGARHYYTFGWSGTLDAAVRRTASKQFYEELIAERSRLVQQDPELEIELYAHSHGASLLLYGPEFPYYEQGLLIDRCYMIAAPLHAGLIASLLSGFFRTIINIYSEGDRVQRLDCLSLPYGVIKRTLRELGIFDGAARALGITLIDLVCAVEGDRTYVGHNAFCTLDRGGPALALLHPLPLITLFPLLHEVVAAQQPGLHSLSCDISCASGSCLVQVQSEATGYCQVAVPDELYATCAVARTVYQGDYSSELRKLLYSAYVAANRLLG